MHAFWQGIYSFVHVLFRHVRSHWICWNFSPPTAFCDFSVIFHQIFLIFCQYEENQLCISCIHFCVWRSKVKVTFGWSVVLDKGTTCYKFWGHMLKVKVMRRQVKGRGHEEATSENQLYSIFSVILQHVQWISVKLFKSICQLSTSM